MHFGVGPGKLCENSPHLRRLLVLDQRQDVGALDDRKKIAPGKCGCQRPTSQVAGCKARHVQRQVSTVRSERTLGVERLQAQTAGGVIEMFAALGLIDQHSVEFGGPVYCQIEGASLKLVVGAQPARSQEAHARLGRQRSQVDPQFGGSFVQRLSTAHRQTHILLSTRSGKQILRAKHQPQFGTIAGQPSRQFGVEETQLRLTPLTPRDPLRPEHDLGPQRKSLVALRGHFDLHLLRNAGRRCVVQPPRQPRQHAVSASGESHGNASERRVMPVAPCQFVDDVRNRGLHPWVEQIVVRPRRFAGMRFSPSATVGADKLDARALRVARTPQRLQRRQWRCQLNGGDEPQAFAVEHPQQGLQHVLSQGVGAARGERAGVVPRRRAEGVDRRERASVRGDADHRGVVAIGTQLLCESSTGVEECAPSVDAEAARGVAVEHLRGTEAIGQTRCADVRRNESAVVGGGGRWGLRRSCGRGFHRALDDANRAELRGPRGGLIGQQQHRRRRAWPEDNAAPNDGLRGARAESPSW